MAVLQDDATFKRRGHNIFILPSPGHMFGSVSLIMEAGGRKVAFSGDLFHSAEKILDLWDTQVNSSGAEGIYLGAFSLSRLREQKPARAAFTGDAFFQSFDPLQGMLRHDRIFRNQVRQASRCL